MLSSSDDTASEDEQSKYKFAAGSVVFIPVTKRKIYYSYLMDYICENNEKRHVMKKKVTFRCSF